MWNQLSVKEWIERVIIIIIMLMLLHYDKGEDIFILLTGFGFVYLHEKMAKNNRQIGDLKKEILTLKEDSKKRHRSNSAI